MRWRTVAVVVLFCASVQNARGAEREQPGGIEEKGKFSLAAPGEGMGWKKVQEAEQKGVKISVYAAVKEGSKSKIVLIVEHQEADTDAKRVARIKGAYNGM